MVSFLNAEADWRGRAASNGLGNMSDAIKTEIKLAIVKSLRLTIAPQEILDDVPLFGDGLGLDSVDALQLVLELERKFGVVVSDEHVGTRVLRSVNTIADFIVLSRGAAS